MFDENYNKFRLKILSILFDCNLSDSEREQVLAKMDEKKARNIDFSKIYKEDFSNFCLKMGNMLRTAGFSTPHRKRILKKINEEKAIGDNLKTDKEKREIEALEWIDNNVGSENDMNFADELRKKAKEKTDNKYTECAKKIVENFKEKCDRGASLRHCTSYFILGGNYLDDAYDDYGYILQENKTNPLRIIDIDRFISSGKEVTIPITGATEECCKGFGNVQTYETENVEKEIRKQLSELGFSSFALREVKIRVKFCWEKYNSGIKKDFWGVPKASSFSCEKKSFRTDAFVYLIDASW